MLVRNHHSLRSKHAGSPSVMICIEAQLAGKLWKMLAANSTLGMSSTCFLVFAQFNLEMAGCHNSEIGLDLKNFATAW